MRGSETIVVHRSTGQNRFGESSGTDPDVFVRSCIILPRESTREIDGRQSTVISGLVVYAPPGSDIRATDEVTARGVRWRVDGEPGDYRSAGGQRKTLAVNLERVQG